MKKPVVDYRAFRLSRIHEPQYAHLKLLLGWVVYFVLYFITEAFIPAEICTVIHSPLDDRIPFLEVFVIPYVGWYLLVAGSLIYFLRYDVESFKKLQIFIIITQVIAMASYILFPNRQDLRPTEFPRENFLTQIVAFLYLIDTNTNVCPSLHVGYSLAIASVWLKKWDASPRWKTFVVIAVILICLSTAFIKQHSTVDIFAAIALCVLAEGIVYGRSYWLARLRGEK